MQMGTRWAVGAETPARLPQLVVDAVKTIEAELEGNPVVELDDGKVIRYSGGEVFVVASTD